MQSETPRISVIMSVYGDNPAYLQEAIDSILCQTLMDFEFIIVNDSADESLRDILRKYSLVDTRIRIIENEANLGLTKSLNKAASIARGEYIARMDADDISLPQRFQQQLQFLDMNGDHGLVGSSFREFANGRVIEQRLPLVTNNDRIRTVLPRFNPFCHSSVIMTKEAFDSLQGYDELFRYAQDYDLWLRLSRRYKVANLPDVLLLRRMENNISLRRERQQKLFAVKAQAKALANGDLPWYCFVHLLRPLLVSLAPRQFLRVIRHIKYGEGDL